MADDVRTAPHPLTALDALAQSPLEFDFFHALRELERLHLASPRWGEAARPRDEPVRLGQDPSMVFAATTLASYDGDRPALPPRLGVHFFGMFGPNGALPFHLTEYAKQRLYHHGDATFARFVDIFHHRFLSLVYRVWASSRPAVQHDRPERDRFSHYMGTLSGRACDAMRDRDALPDRAKAFHAGRLASQTRNAEGLCAMVEDFFQVPAKVEEFIGEWLPIPEPYVWKVGAVALRGAPPLGRLGLTTMLGSRMWSVQHKFRLSLGPLSRHRFGRLAPGGESVPRLVALVRNYVGDELAWDVRLVPEPEAVQPMQLGISRLARTTWLVRDADQLTQWEDLIFDPRAQLESTGSTGHV